MVKALAKGRRADAERAAEHALVHHWGCKHTRRAIKTQFQSVDFFGSDVVGKREDGSHVYCQVTAGQQAETVRRRRRKLDYFPWHGSDTVLLLQLKERADKRPKIYYFRIHTPDLGTGWDVIGELLVPREWFKKYRDPPPDEEEF